MTCPPLPAPVRLFGLPLLPYTFEQATHALAQAVTQREGHARIVVTPNVDHVVRLHRDPRFQGAYAQAHYRFADGMPLVWASRWLGSPLPARVTGADLTTQLCQLASTSGWRVVVVGGHPGEETMLCERLQASYPGLQVDILSPSMGFDPEGAEAQALSARVSALAPDVVFVCLGAPRQEAWAARLAPQLGGGLVLCVGAAIRFAIGLDRRAPRWMQQAGLEWLWRLASNPRALWRRYLRDDPYFFWLCWKEWRARRAS